MSYEISLIYKKAYGRERYYPDCPQSHLICKLIKRDDGTYATCLVKWQVDAIKEAGWIVNITNA